MNTTGSHRLPTTIEDILNLPLNSKEKSTKSRKVCGCHLFISRWYHNFSTLCSSVKHRIIDIVLQREGENTTSTTSTPTKTLHTSASFDSTNSNNKAVAVVPTSDIMKIGWSKWNSMPIELKDAWNNRADTLNSRPVPGIAVTVPNNWSINQFQQQVFNSIDIEWAKLIGMFRRMIVYSSKNKSCDRLKRYVFGNERIMVMNHVYRSFGMTHLLRCTLFGDNLQNIDSKIIRFKSDKCVVLHVDSMSAMKNLFTFENECCVCFEVNHVKKSSNTLLHSCCGKLRLENNDGMSNVGYIVGESEDGLKWKVHLLNDDIVDITKLRYDEDQCDYMYPHVLEDPTQQYIVRHYSPVRILLGLNKLSCKILLNKVCFDSNKQLIINYSS